MQRLEDIYRRAVEAVLLVGGMSEEQLFVCRSDRCVTARVVLVDVLAARIMREDVVEIVASTLSLDLARD